MPAGLIHEHWVGFDYAGAGECVEELCQIPRGARA